MTAIQDRYGIRAALIIERLRAHAMGELELTATQIRVAEILLRKMRARPARVRKRVGWRRRRAGPGAKA
jgi:hypothetical protein